LPVTFSIVETWSVLDEQAMRSLGAELATRFLAGDVVMLEGELGAGKTTLVRGILAGLGWDQEVRSPTFNLLHTYPSLQPQTVHADLYRVKSWQGIGIEDYLEDWLCLIEWPDRAVGLVPEAQAWQIEIEFEGDGRLVKLWEPSG
jgi:tRNA threonylcarbamoyladenosine biosynthesis protein TsaE